MDDFARRKQRLLSGLVAEGGAASVLGEGDTSSARRQDAGGVDSRADKSLKGAIDALLVPICNLLNSHADYVTTSCCSGRISVYRHAQTASGKRIKSGGRLLFVSHEPVRLSDSDITLSDVLQGSRHYPSKKAETAREKHLQQQPVMSHTDLKLEPLILHVEASSPQAAVALLRAAVAAGLRESGISALGRRNLVALRGSERLEVPLAVQAATLPCELLAADGDAGVSADGEKVLVSPAHFKVLLHICNEKLMCNERQINRLRETLERHLKPQADPKAAFQEADPQQAADKCHTDSLQNGHPRHSTDTSPSQSPASSPASSSAPAATAAQAAAAGAAAAAAGAAAAAVYVGVKEDKMVKAVKTALETLGFFDKSRKVMKQKGDTRDETLEEQLQIHSHDFNLKLIPINANFKMQLLPQHIQHALDIDPSSGEVKTFSLGLSSEAPRVCKQTVAGCLGSLLRAACEAVPGGSLLLQKAEQLRRGSAAAPPAAAPAAGDGCLVYFPNKFERVGDVLLLPSGSLDDFQRLKKEGESMLGVPQMSQIEEHMWRGFCEAYGARAVGLQAAVEGRMRQSRAKLVFGSHGLTTVKENGVIFKFDVTKCMFASGNGTERLRFRKCILEGRGPPETVVDLFCGIGYFCLGALAFAPPHRLKKLYACDINPMALKYFLTSLSANKIDSSRVTFLLCDSQANPIGPPLSDATNAAAVEAAVHLSPACLAAEAAFSSQQQQQQNEEAAGGPPAAAGLPGALLGAADRVSLGLIPSSQEAWPVAVALLSDVRGGTLHIHGVAPLEEVKEAAKAPVQLAVSVHPRDAAGDAATAVCTEIRATITTADDVDAAVGGNCRLGQRLQFAQEALKSVAELVREKAVRGRTDWRVYIHHVERVKSYAPKLFHFVVDIVAQPTSSQ